MGYDMRGYDGRGDWNPGHQPNLNRLKEMRALGRTAADRRALTRAWASTSSRGNSAQVEPGKDRQRPAPGPSPIASPFGSAPGIQVPRRAPVQQPSPVPGVGPAVQKSYGSGLDYFNEEGYGLANGGPMFDAREGGLVPPGPPGVDTVPAMASSGPAMLDSQPGQGNQEYVLPADSTAAAGVENLDAFKDATHNPVAVEDRRYAGGGVVSAQEGKSRADRMFERMMAQSRAAQEAPTPAPVADSGAGGINDDVADIRAQAQKPRELFKRMFGYGNGGLVSAEDAKSRADRMFNRMMANAKAEREAPAELQPTSVPTPPNTDGRMIDDLREKANKPRGVFKRMFGYADGGGLDPNLWAMQAPGSRQDPQEWGRASRETLRAQEQQRAKALASQGFESSLPAAVVPEMDDAGVTKREIPRTVRMDGLGPDNPPWKGRPRYARLEGNDQATADALKGKGEDKDWRSPLQKMKDSLSAEKSGIRRHNIQRGLDPDASVGDLPSRGGIPGREYTAEEREILALKPPAEPQAQPQAQPQAGLAQADAAPALEGDLIPAGKVPKGAKYIGGTEKGVSTVRDGATTLGYRSDVPKELQDELGRAIYSDTARGATPEGFRSSDVPMGVSPGKDSFGGMDVRNMTDTEYSAMKAQYDRENAVSKRGLARLKSHLKLKPEDRGPMPADIAAFMNRPLVAPSKKMVMGADERARQGRIKAFETQAGLKEATIGPDAKVRVAQIEQRGKDADDVRKRNEDMLARLEAAPMDTESENPVDLPAVFRSLPLEVRTEFAKEKIGAEELFRLYGAQLLAARNAEFAAKFAYNQNPDDPKTRAEHDAAVKAYWTLIDQVLKARG